MKAIVHQTLGYIHRFDAGTLLELSKIDDEFVRDESRGTRVEDRIVLLKPLGHVVRIEDSHLRSHGQSISTHQRHINPRDCHDTWTAVGSRRNRPDGSSTTETSNRMARQKWRQVSS